MYCNLLEKREQSFSIHKKRIGSGRAKKGLEVIKVKGRRKPVLYVREW
jgi:hypothetical protein